MPTGHEDWATVATLDGGTVSVTHVTTIDQVTVITGVSTAKVVNKATTVLETGTTQHYIGTINVTTGVGVTELTKTFAGATVKFPYGALLVTYYNDEAGEAYALFAHAGTAVTYPTRPGYIASFGTLVVVGTPPPVLQQAIVPISCTKGTPLTLRIYKHARIGSGGGTFKVYGLTSNPGVQLRSDGRTYPIGSRNAWATGVTISITLIPAPVSPLRVMMRDLFVSTTSNIAVVLETGGQQLLYAYSNRDLYRQWESGLLLGPGHTVKLTIGGTGHAGVSCSYDLVV